MKVRVLSISHLYPTPNDEFKGLVVHQQMKELINLGHEVKVLSPIAWTPFLIRQMKQKWKAYSKIPEHIERDGIDIYYPRYLVFPKALFLASSGSRLYHEIKGLTDYIYKMFPFDLIHAHAALPDGYAAMLLAQEYRKPLVITFRATDVDITIHRSRKCFNAIHKVFEKSSKIIAPSPRLKDTLYEQMKIESEVICSGIYQKDIFTGVTSLGQQYKGRYILLSVSRLIKTKGIDLNLKAIAELQGKYPNIYYLIIGNGEERARLERLVKDLNLQDKVEFLGQIPHQEVMEYMSLCDIFSLPSWQETLGLVYLEAMAHSKPVIGCLGQGVDDIITQGETGLLAEPKDISSLVEAMKFLLDHPQKAKMIGEKAKELVLTSYTWDVSGTKTIKVYREVLEQSA